MRNVNARVPGLVGFLDLITDGRAPDTLSGIIQAQVDLSPYIRLGKRERLANVSPTVGASGGLTRLTFDNFQPAPNEFWIVDHFTIQTDLVNAQIAAYPSMFPIVGANPLDIAVGPVVDNNGAGVVVSSGRDFILPAGFVLRGATVENSTGAVFSGAGTILFTRVRI